jgi:hypothetical protein
MRHSNWKSLRGASRPKFTTLSSRFIRQFNGLNGTGHGRRNSGPTHTPVAVTTMWLCIFDATCPLSGFPMPPGRLTNNPDSETKINLTHGPANEAAQINRKNSRRSYCVLHCRGSHACSAGWRSRCRCRMRRRIDTTQQSKKASDAR